MKLKVISASLLMAMNMSVFANESVISDQAVAKQKSVVTADKNETSLNDANITQLNHLVSSDSAEPIKQAADHRSAQEVIEDLMDQYIQANHLNNGVKAFSASVEAVRGKDSADAATARQLAYQQALLMAESEFVLWIAGNTISNQQQLTQADNSSNRNEFNTKDLPTTDSWSALYHKYMALKNSELDQKLREQGVDPSKIAQNPTARKELALSHYINSIFTQGFYNLSGILPVKTFMVDKDGHTVIGVVVIYSAKIKSLVQDLQSGVMPALTGQSGMPLSKFIDKPNKLLMSNYGVRVVFNEQNKPVILSYAQTSYTTKNSLPELSSQDMAKNQAVQLARANLATFINSVMNVSLSSKMGTEVSQAIVRDLSTGKDSQDMQQVVTNIIKNNYTINASASIEGVQTVKTWRYIPEKTNQHVYGVVLAWTPEGYELAENVKNDMDATNNMGASSQGDQESVTSSEDNPYLHQF